MLSVLQTIPNIRRNITRRLIDETTGGMIVVGAMKQCLQLKYEQSEEFRVALERSKGKYIVEDQSTFRKKYADTWGVKRQGDFYVGPNLMGRLLMELRDNGFSGPSPLPLTANC